jgi:hypothetical protein
MAESDNLYDGYCPIRRRISGKQRVFAGLAANAQTIAVGFRKTGALKTVAYVSLQVIDARKIAESGDVLKVEVHSLTAPPDALVEF